MPLFLLASLLSASEWTTIELNPSESRPAALEAVLRAERVNDREVLPALEVVQRLATIDEPRVPNVDGLDSMLADANELEARFDTAGANAMRVNVIRSYDAALRIDKQLISLAASASQDRAAAALVSGEELAATEAARESVRRFPDIALDTKKHAPPVQAVFDKVREQLSVSESGTLTVESETPGVVHADGWVLGRVEGSAGYELPFGRYRVWVETDAGPTFAHEIDVRADQPAEVKIDGELESALRYDGMALGLHCPEERCTALLQRLAEATSLEGAIGVTARDGDVNAVLVDVRGGILRQDARIGAAGKGQFRALYLAPAGIGQIAQERYVAGGVYAATVLGAGALNLSLSDDDETAKNFSAGLFYGLLVATAVESVVVWSLD